MDPQYLESVEAIYGIQLPEIYRQVSRDKIYTEYLKRPALLLLNHGFELLEENVIVDIAEWVNDDFSPQEFTCIPFAKSSMGDYFCIAYPKENDNGDDSVIIYLPHDYSEYIYLAKSFEDFMFRHFLERLTDLGLIDFKQQNFSIQEVLKQFLRLHQNYLSAEQIELLQDILLRDIQEFDNGSVGYLSERECHAILDSLIPFEHLDQEVSF